MTTICKVCKVTKFKLSTSLREMRQQDYGNVIFKDLRKNVTIVKRLGKKKVELTLKN